MRKTALVVALAFLLGAMAWGEIEIGGGLAPSGNFLNDSTKVFHVGYSFLWLFYAAYDGMILPPYSVQQLLTSGFGTGSISEGYFRPGFLNTFNAGIRPTFGPVSLMASVGINQLYVYRQGADNLNVPPIGVNLKLGAGFRLAKWLGLTVTGMTVFGDFNDLSDTLKAVASKATTEEQKFVQQEALDRILNNLFPAITLNLYL
jgi:hypothetical protein